MNLISSLKFNIDKIREIDNEEDAYTFFCKLRWPDGVTCSSCGKKDKIRPSSIYKQSFYCSNCVTNFSPKTRTILHQKQISYLKLFKFIVYSYFDRCKIKIVAQKLNKDYASLLHYHRLLGPYFGYVNCSVLQKNKIKEEKEFRQKEYKKKYELIQLTKDMTYIAKYSSQVEAAKAIGLTRQAVSLVVSTGTRTAGGYRWMYSIDYVEYLRLLKDRKIRSIHDFYYFKRNGEIKKWQQKKNIISIT